MAMGTILTSHAFCTRQEEEVQPDTLFFVSDVLVEITAVLLGC